MAARVPDSTITSEIDAEKCGSISFLSHSRSEESLETNNNPTPSNFTLPRNWKHNQTPNNTILPNTRERSATLPLPHFSRSTSSASGTFNFENCQRQVNLQVISSFASSEGETADPHSDSEESDESSVSFGSNAVVYKGSYKLRYKSGDVSNND